MSTPGSMSWPGPPTIHQLDWSLSSSPGDSASGSLVHTRVLPCRVDLVRMPVEGSRQLTEERELHGLQEPDKDPHSETDEHRAAVWAVEAFDVLGEDIVR